MKEFDNLLKTVRALRSPGGCPWDRAQKISDMKKYLLEEVYELIDAIDAKETEAIKEELGDIFLILAVIAEMHKEKKKFTPEEILEYINEKLISRHPHVFASLKLKTKEEVLNHWIINKAKAKKRKSIKDRLPLGAPSLLLAGVFFKERSHLTKKRTKQDQEKQLIEVKDKLSGLKVKKNKEKILTDIIFEICKYGFDLGVDLEGALRRKVLKAAGRTSY